MLYKALCFATEAHKGQERKFTAEPYIVHPVEVMGFLMAYVKDVTPEMCAAALLHDVVEDTRFTHKDIYQNFGETVWKYVIGLTDQYTSCYVLNGVRQNRAARKLLERQRLANECAEVQTIKCADLLSNTKTIVEFDRGFAKVYLKEKEEVLKLLTKADNTLWNVTNQSLYNSKEKLYGIGTAE
jgi:(p)ppGpp synthase/HD superfamily hydrolase